MNPDAAVEWESARSVRHVFVLLHRGGHGRPSRKLALALAAVCRRRWAGLIDALGLTPLLDTLTAEPGERPPPQVLWASRARSDDILAATWAADDSLPDGGAAKTVCTALRLLHVRHCYEAAGQLENAERILGRLTTEAGLPAAIREVLGNPFRAVTFDPAWRTSAAVAVAEGVYAARDFARLPVLADALEDAGCDAADLLGHLRGPGPHVRGCWALDLVLGNG